MGILDHNVDAVRCGQVDAEPPSLLSRQLCTDGILLQPPPPPPEGEELGDLTLSHLAHRVKYLYFFEVLLFICFPRPPVIPSLVLFNLFLIIYPFCCVAATRRRIIPGYRPLLSSTGMSFVYK